MSTASEAFCFNMPRCFYLKEKICARNLLKTTTQEFKMPTSGRSKTFLLKLPDNSLLSSWSGTRAQVINTLKTDKSMKGNDIILAVLQLGCVSSNNRSE